MSLGQSFTYSFTKHRLSTEYWRYHGEQDTISAHTVWRGVGKRFFITIIAIEHLHVLDTLLLLGDCVPRAVTGLGDWVVLVR